MRFQHCIKVLPQTRVAFTPNDLCCCYDYRLNSSPCEKNVFCLLFERKKLAKREREKKTWRRRRRRRRWRRKMNGKGEQGWCMLRCAGVTQDNSEMINRTMLRFRPIAPKPVTNSTVSGNVLVDNKNSLVTSKRSKRKYVRVRKNNSSYNNKRKSRISSHKETEQEDDDLNKNVVTLQLLPEKTTYMKEETWCNNLVDLEFGAKVDDNRRDRTPNWSNFSDHLVMINDDHAGTFGFPDQKVVMCSQRRLRVTVESWVTVESVADTCMDTRGLGSTDVERLRNLQGDTCPGFLSDGLNRVSWVNEAYKKMVTESQESLNDCFPSPEMEIMVWLVIKSEFPSFNYDDPPSSSFTTKVRLQYNTCHKEKYSQIVPCDVFRMDGGGFAWRLDVESALSLGR